MSGDDADYVLESIDHGLMRDESYEELKTMSGPKTSFLDRVKWLADHPVLLANWPSGEHIIKFRMQQAGLISSKTSAKFMDIGKLVIAARKEIHERNKKLDSKNRG